jgi:excisionase family DNA binding protein
METEKSQLDRIESLLRTFIPTQKEILTLDEACQFLQLSKSKIYKMTATNQIPHVKKGRLYFSRKKLVEFIIGNND